MATEKLTNYLRTHRKRLGLTQKQVAFLLECEADKSISRHETFSRVPSLETALAYEAIYGVPIRELFAGMFEEVDQKIAKQRRRLIEQLDAAEPARLADQQRGALIIAKLEHYSLTKKKNDDEQMCEK